MKVYKVVQRIARYPLQQDGPRYSIMAIIGIGAVPYGKGMETRPIPGYGPLAAFEDLNSALGFIEGFSRNWEIWEAEAELSKRGRFYIPTCLKDVKAFWDAVRKHETFPGTLTHEVPPGTLWCESITLTKMVDSQEMHLEREMEGIK